MWDVSQRELENLCNQVEKKKKKKGEDVLRNHNLKIIPQYFYNKF